MTFSFRHRRGAKAEAGVESVTGGLAARTVSGAVWTTIGAVAQFFLHGIIFVILARVLSAEDFGVYALAIVVVTVSRVFGEVGLGPSLIQRREIDDAHIRTAFTSTMILSLMIALAIAGLAPILSTLMGNAQLEPVLRVLALLFPLHGLGLIASSLLARQLRFQEIARTEILSYLVGYGFVGVPLAFAGWGYWSLVSAALMQTVMQSFQLLILLPHPKRPAIHMPALKDLLSFGVGNSLARIGHQLAMKGDYVVVGRFLGVAPLGIYSRAYQLMGMLVVLYQSAANKVLFSAASKVQDDRKRLARAHARGAAMTALLFFPTGLVLCALAPELIHVFLGSKWAAVVPPFQFLALGMFFRGGYSLNAAIARGAGDVRRLAIRQWIYATIVIGGAWVGHFYGVTGVAIGVTLALAAHFVMLSRIGLQASGLSLKGFAAAHIPALLISLVLLVSATLAATIMRNLEAPDIAVLTVSLGVAMGITVLTIRQFPSILGRDGMWALQSVRELLPQGKAFDFVRIVLPRQPVRVPRKNRVAEQSAGVVETVR